MIVGVKWTRKPSSCMPSDSSPPNASNANKEMNRMNTIAKTLGAQISRSRDIFATPIVSFGESCPICAVSVKDGTDLDCGLCAEPLSPQQRCHFDYPLKSVARLV